MQTIKFNDNYPKLHNQTTAKLVAMFDNVSANILFRQFPDLLKFDTKKQDGSYFEIEPRNSFLLLLFVGNKNIMFSTLRKSNDENFWLYKNSIGEEFNIVIEEV